MNCGLSYDKHGPDELCPPDPYTRDIDENQRWQGVEQLGADLRGGVVSRDELEEELAALSLAHAALTARIVGLTELLAMDKVKTNV